MRQRMRRLPICGACAHIWAWPSVEGWQRARAAAVKALELDPMLAEAHDALAIVLECYDWAWTAAKKEFRRAIELNPNYANVRLFYRYFLYALRRPKEARAQIEHPLKLDPHNSMFHHALGFQLFEQGRPEEAFGHFQRAITLQPDTLFAHGGLMAVLEAKGEYKRAWPKRRSSLRYSAQQTSSTFWTVVTYKAVIATRSVCQRMRWHRNPSPGLAH